MATNATNNKIPCLSYSDPGLNHTTFVQADPSTFRALVQKLTGAPEDPSTEKLPVTVSARHQTGKSVTSDMGPRKPEFKLHERRQSMRKLEIKLGGSGGCYGGGGCSSASSVSAAAHKRWFAGVGEIMLVSPVSPFDLFGRGSPRTPSEEEEKAIAEKGFYLHPSPLSTPRSAEPELLPLFPLHSPRESTSP